MMTEKNLKKCLKGRKQNIYIYKLASRAIIQSVTGSGTLHCSVKLLNKNN